MIPVNGVVEVSLMTTPGDPVAAWEYRVDGGVFHRAVVDAEGYRIRAPSGAHLVADM